MTLTFTVLGFDLARITAHFGVAECLRDISDVLGLDIDRLPEPERLTVLDRGIKKMSGFWVGRMNR